MDKDELLKRYEARGDEADFLDARRRYEAALAETPDDPRLLNDYGYLLECHGRYAIRAATDAYRRAIELDPGWAKPRLQLISAAAALQEPQDAVEHYQQRLQASPNDPEEHRYLATALLADHRFVEAELVARRGLGLQPDDAALTNRLADALAGQDRAMEALDLWRRAYVLDPENLEGRYASAFLLEREARLPEAMAEWQFIIDWTESHGHDIDAEWPTRELERLRSLG